MEDNDLSRRDFLKKTGKVALACSTSLYFNSLIGCATLPEETREAVANFQWECNPIIPIPKIGAYTGTNNQRPVQVSKGFREKYGISSAFNAGGRGSYWTSNGAFPKQGCEWLIQRGIVPVIRYIIVGDTDNEFTEVADGKFDDDIKTFAHQAAEFGRPLVLVPWQGVNEPYWGQGGKGQAWRWSRGDANAYVAAWVRMHNLFRREGANKNVVWSTKMIAGGFGPGHPALDWAAYTPPKEYVDIIGWNCNAHISVFGSSYDAAVTFRNQFRRDYIEAVEKYPTKPQMFWELGAYRSKGQAAWMDKALTKIREKYFWVKGVMWDVMATPWGNYDPVHTSKTIEVIRKHFASGYFIGRALS